MMILLSILLTLAIVIVAAVVLPASISRVGLFHFVGVISGLLAYAGVAFAVGDLRAENTRMSLRIGASVGAVMAVIGIVFHLLEANAALSVRDVTLVGVGNWAVLFLGLGAAGSAAYRANRSTALAILASVWAAIVSTTYLVLVAFIAGLLFMAQSQRQLAAAFDASGMTDARAFVVRNTMASAVPHLLLPPLLAVILGFAGAWSASFLSRAKRSSAATIAAAAALLLIGGLLSIRHASVLDRSDRPPFIMFGLTALALTLSCAWSVVTALGTETSGVKGA